MVFGSRVHLFPFAWGQFSQLWQLMLRKSHGERHLKCYSPWGCKRVTYNLANKQNNMSWIQSGHHVVNFFFQVGVPLPTDITLGVTQNSILSPWGENECPWFCLMIKLLIFTLIGLFSLASAFSLFSDYTVFLAKFSQE